MAGTLARDYQFYRGPELSSPSCGWSWTRGLTLSALVKDILKTL